MSTTAPGTHVTDNLDNELDGWTRPLGIDVENTLTMFVISGHHVTVEPSPAGLSITARINTTCPDEKSLVTSFVLHGDTWVDDNDATGIIEAGALLVDRDDEMFDALFSRVPFYMWNARLATGQTRTNDIRGYLTGDNETDLRQLDLNILYPLAEILQIVPLAARSGWHLTLNHSLSTAGDRSIRLTATPPEQADVDSDRTPRRTDNRPVAHALTWIRTTESWTLDETVTPDSEGPSNVRRALDDIELYPASFTLSLEAAAAITGRWHSDGSLTGPSALPARPLPHEPAPTPAELKKRAQDIARWATEHEFSELLLPQPATVAAFLTDNANGTAGYYLLEFADGQCYIGESVNIASRLTQHLSRFRDITTIRVRPETEHDATTSVLDHKRLLRLRERQLIHRAQESKLLARNVNEMATLIGVSKHLDEIIPDTLQRRWLNAPDTVNRADSTTQRIDHGQFLGAADNFRRFTSIPASAEVLDLIGQYLSRCVPYPLQTEYQSWSASCLPTTRTIPRRLSCVSIAMTETFVVNRDQASGIIGGFIQVNDAELFSGGVASELAFLRRHPHATLRAAHYQESGPGQTIIFANSLAQLQRLLDDVAVTRAATTALNIMRRGPSMHRRSHCPQLVAAALNL
ncbi:GIY-YIG nuclease family protein [Rhodococcoides fascians]|uniref:GIY-YIG nuclease family protein n=1 Tax=Rhodococcoides fascians TaxID=1828 RepID=UPI00055BEAB8|nr:GIY-YIG nuclease family protein [Rhodococcus fascians]